MEICGSVTGVRTWPGRRLPNCAGKQRRRRVILYIPTQAEAIRAELILIDSGLLDMKANESADKAVLAELEDIGLLTNLFRGVRAWHKTKVELLDIVINFSLPISILLMGSYRAPFTVPSFPFDGYIDYILVVSSLTEGGKSNPSNDPVQNPPTPA